MNLRKWSAVLMVAACFLWAVSCAQKGAAKVTELTNTPALNGVIEVEETASAYAEPVSAGEAVSEIPPHGSRVLRLGEGGGKALEEFGFPPALKIRADGAEYDAVRPSCTWTKDGQTLIACGMEPFSFGETMEPIPLPANPGSDPELVFELNPDRMTVTIRYKTGGAEYGEPDVREYYEPENGWHFPPDAECIFMIEAEWDVKDGFGGTGVYVFHTVTAE